MKISKPKGIGPHHLQPVWCHRCSIRIAPYDSRTVFRGKDYHRDCYTKLVHVNGKAGKN